jgi:chromosome segregation ATPase
MVDVKLDVGDSPFKKKSGTGICRVLMYLLLIGAVAILALDAAEFISLGIVSGVMGLKVMKVEDFTSMTAAHEITKTQLEEQERKVKAGLEERDGLKGQVKKFNGELDNLKKAAADKQSEINAVTGEVETLKKQLKDLSAERDGLKKAAADNEKKIDAVTEERDTFKKQLEMTQLKSDQLKKQGDQTDDVKAGKIAEAVVKDKAAESKKNAGNE